MKKLITLLVIVLCFAKVQAQISFPKGNAIDTVIHVDVAYYETQIIFNTGIYKSSDYLYEKISDSLDPNWLVTACFNGDCHNDLEQSGKFISDFGINDTTCFIAFHVESHDINGKSSIRYKVINSKDPDDQAVLKVDVTYISTTGFDELNRQKTQVNYYPNPASKLVNISIGQPTDFKVKVIDMSGKLLLENTFNNANLATINTSSLRKGMYFIQVINGGNILTKKLVIQ